MASRSVRASGSCGVRPGGVGAGKGRRSAGQVFFHVPVRPGISMNLGKNCFRRAFNNFKFHLHGLKRYVKKHLPRRPPPFPGPNARPGLTPQEPLALTEEVAASTTANHLLGPSPPIYINFICTKAGCVV